MLVHLNMTLAGSAHGSSLRPACNLLDSYYLGRPMKGISDGLVTKVGFEKQLKENGSHSQAIIGLNCSNFRMSYMCWPQRWLQHVSILA